MIFAAIKRYFQFNYYQQQAEYYESYITDCLRKQTASDRNKKPSKGIRASIRPGKSTQGIKYSASELMKKGVLVEVIDVDIKSPYKGLQVRFRFPGTEDILTNMFSFQQFLSKTYQDNGMFAQSTWELMLSPPESFFKIFYKNNMKVFLLWFQEIVQKCQFEVRNYAYVIRVYEPTLK